MEIHPQHWGSVGKISWGGVEIDSLKIYILERDADKNSLFINIYGLAPFVFDGTPAIPHVVLDKENVQA